MGKQAREPDLKSVAQPQRAALARAALTPSPPTLTSSLFTLQRRYGNRYVRRMMVQARLAVGPVDDPYEREADRVAATVVQRESALEESELQTKPLVQRSGGDGGFEVSGDVEQRIRRSKGGGNALPGTTRAEMEQHFGADFSEVRVHTESEAAGLNRALSARAFTQGNDVYFGEGQFAPASGEGKRLLAHELVHVVQQTATPDDLAHRHRLVSDSASLQAIQRFEGDEHHLIGSEAASGVSTDIDIGVSSVPEYLSFADVVAMAGDFFRDLDEMKRLSQSGLDGRQQLRYARWKATKIGNEPRVSIGAKKSVDDRYALLAANNASHFRAGGGASNEYERYHIQALSMAFESGVQNNSSKWTEALSIEAFGCHFLTDLFSAGHVRTPRAEIKTWYDTNLPRNIERLVSHMAQHMHTYLADQHSVLNAIGQIPSQTTIERNIRRIGGPAVDAFSLGDIVSKAFHDRDSRGLNVVSDTGVDRQGNPIQMSLPQGFQWVAVGDDELGKSPVTKAMAVAAVRASIADLERVREMGAISPPRPFQTVLAQIQPFRAQDFVPREGQTFGNATLAWQWGHLNNEMWQAVDATVKGFIANVLVEKSREQPNTKEGNITREALNDLAQYLRTDGIRVLERAISSDAR